MENLDFLDTCSLSAHMLTANSGNSRWYKNEPTHRAGTAQNISPVCEPSHYTTRCPWELKMNWTTASLWASKHRCTNDLCNLVSCTDMNSHCSVSSGHCNCSPCWLLPSRGQIVMYLRSVNISKQRKISSEINDCVLHMKTHFYDLTIKILEDDTMAKNSLLHFQPKQIIATKIWTALHGSWDAHYVCW